MFKRKLSWMLVLAMVLSVMLPVWAEEEEEDKLPEQIDVKKLESTAYMVKGQDGKDWVALHLAFHQQKWIATKIASAAAASKVAGWFSKDKKGKPIFVQYTLTPWHQLAVMHAMKMAMPQFKEGKEFKASYKEWAKKLHKIIVKTGKDQIYVREVKTPKKDKQGAEVKDKQGNVVMVTYKFYYLSRSAEWFKTALEKGVKEEDKDVVANQPPEDVVTAIKAGQPTVKPEEVKQPEEVKPEEGKTEEGKTEEGKTEEGKTEEGKTEEKPAEDTK